MGAGYNVGSVDQNKFSHQINQPKKGISKFLKKKNNFHNFLILVPGVCGFFFKNDYMYYKYSNALENTYARMT